MLTACRCPAAATTFDGRSDLHTIRKWPSQGAWCVQVSDVRVYEVDGLLVPGTVALGLQYAPRPYGVKKLAPILRKLAAQGPVGWHLRN